MSILPSMIAAAGAAAARAEGGQVDAFRVAGATSPDRARPLEAMALVRDTAFARLSARGVIRAAGPGFYHDEAALAARRDGRPPRTMLAVAPVGCASSTALAVGMRLR